MPEINRKELPTGKECGLGSPLDFLGVSAYPERSWGISLIFPLTLHYKQITLI